MSGPTVAKRIVAVKRPGRCYRYRRNLGGGRAHANGPSALTITECPYGYTLNVL